MDISSYQMMAPNEPLEQLDRAVKAEVGEVVVEVAGCGVCHTDIGFWNGGVETRMDLPLTLGHEISGKVVEGPDNLLDRPVIVPAVIPCAQCWLCEVGRGNVCRAQKMPGNDFHGGFASHVVVPEHFLCPVSDEALEDHDLAQLAVIADAVSTPYQVMVRSGIQTGDFAIVIGVGGVGTYGAQLARVFGAQVLAIDIDQDRLDSLAQVGIEHTLNSKGLGVRDVKKLVKAKARELGARSVGWKIFEMSGSRPGQELAYALLGPAATLSVVGFTMDKLELRLSNLMAFDAEVIGTWGCRPEHYPAVVDLVAGGKIQLKPFTETKPLSSINEVFQDAVAHKLERRVVLVP